MTPRLRECGASLSVAMSSCQDCGTQVKDCKRGTRSRSRERREREMRERDVFEMEPEGGGGAEGLLRRLSEEFKNTAAKQESSILEKVEEVSTKVGGLKKEIEAVDKKVANHETSIKRLEAREPRGADRAWGWWRCCSTVCGREGVLHL